IQAYDPIAMENGKKLLKNVVFCANGYEAAKDVDLLVVVTEWNEFREIDLQKVKQQMKQPVVIDGRNIYNPETMQQLGFSYGGVGR
ncbi:MAG: UDP binding domain-containing protein, partial [Candidatus Levyibacteriota bacterium]